MTNNDAIIKIEVKKYPNEGFLQNTYSALQNYKTKSGQITDFRISKDALNLDLKHINIECQPSYDGTVNLIMNDDLNVPRLINTRFSKVENQGFKVINRNQIQQTNIYEESNLDQQTRLIKNSNFFPIIDLLGVDNSGCLNGGNYTLYLKYIDGDFNESPIMCESGQISIFHGNSPIGISGTLENEITTKSIRLYLSNLDTSYNAFKLYYVRSYSNVDGAKLTEAVEFVESFSFEESNKELVITGFEATSPITIDELNLRYQTMDSVNTQTQVQNMLFFGNIEKTVGDNSDLQQCSYFIRVCLKQGKSIGFVNDDYTYKTDIEYYNPENIYYRLGYWPGEYYRLGIVYIMNDDSYSPVFNLRGCVFEKVWNDTWSDATNYEFAANLLDVEKYDKSQLLEQNVFLTTDSKKSNTFGVFKNPKEEILNEYNSTIITKSGVRPYYYEMTIPKEVQQELKKLGVKGYFFVRQKRIPTIFGQGVAFGVDKTSYAPMIPISQTNYITEGFLYKDKDEDVLKLKSNDKFEESIIKTDSKQKQSSCLLSLDADVSPDLQSVLCGTEFSFECSRGGFISRKDRRMNFSFDEKTQTSIYRGNAVYVSPETPYKFIQNYGFSTKFGTAEEVKTISFFGKPITNTTADEDARKPETVEPKDVLKSDTVYGAKNRNLLRGIYNGVIGITTSLEDGKLYNIRIPDYSDFKSEEYFNIRKNDLSDFFAISNRYLLEDADKKIDVFRGDCYTNTVTIRLNRNFVDPSTPIMDTIVDKKTWSDNYRGYLQMKSSGEGSEEGPSGLWSYINRSDINAVPLGMWFTYKCLSSNNLGLRIIDRSYVDEQALLGNPRSFYPISGINIYSSGKVQDSSSLNLGYSSTVGHLKYFPLKNIPYTKELFDNRIMFSNIQVEDEFQNGYRVFQNLAYKDIDRQYGAIVKLLPWGTDLLCVFEHGIGIIPVNQKALWQTTTGQSIHMYGSGVLQSQITLITGDYGSTWQESIIKTPVGVYGVDTFTKKIWRFSSHKGFETISDMVVQRFLNEHMLLSENDMFSQIGLKNVKTHYNNYKGDVIFTFYNKNKHEEWSLCYNERLGKWTTRYSWIPIYSENINNVYLSFDKHKTEVLSQISKLSDGSSGITITPIDGTITYDKIYKKYIIKDTKNLNKSTLVVRANSGKTSYFDENGIEKTILIDNDAIKTFINIDKEPGYYNILTLDGGAFISWWKEQFRKQIGTYIDTWIPISKKDIMSEYWNIEDVYTDSTPQSDLPVEFMKDAELIEQDVWTGNALEKKQVWCYRNIEYVEDFEDGQTPCEIPMYLWLDVSVTHDYNSNGSTSEGISREYSLAFLVNSKILTPEDKILYDKMFINGVYVHGRAGIFDEIDYTDDSSDNKILPTKWYDKQEPFEFEFIINNPIGIHKVFENLTIISNNVAPESIQFEIEGDSYFIWRTLDDNVNPTYNKNLKKQQYQNNTIFKNASVKWDSTLNQYSILMTQECKSIEKFGRRLGNMHYKEDSWHITINPLLLNKNGKTVSTKLRDKYLKVRVRYSGEDLAVITAIKSMVNLSAS